MWRIAPDGRVLRKYGKPGGRPPLGKFDPAGLLNPFAIAVDRNGRLWVAEADDQPKRYSVWNPDGSLYRGFFGSLIYSTRAWVDPADPRDVYANSVRYRVDYDRGTWAVDSTFFRPFDLPAPDRSSSAKGEGAPLKFAAPGHHHGAVIVNLGGRKFLWNREDRALHEIVGDRLVPRLKLGDGGGPWWVDRNNDGKVQGDELIPNPGEAIGAAPWFGAPIDGRLNLYFYRGDRWANQGNPPSSKPFQVLRWNCLGFNDRGGLHYADPRKPDVVAADATGGRVSDLTVDGDGNVYVLVSGGTLDRGVRAQGSGHRVVAYSSAGKLLWEYQNVHCAFAWASEPYTPGHLVGPTGFATGSTDGLIALTGYYGQYFLLDRKTGLFVDALGEDQRGGYTMGPHMVLTENFNGSLFRHPANGKTYFLGGDADARLWEVTGLDTIKRSSGAVEVTPADAARSRENARAAVAAAFDRRRGKSAAVVRLRGAAADGKPEKWAGVQPMPIALEADRSATAWLGYDDRNLYVRFQVQSDVPLLNTPTDYRLLFKSGSAVEVQLGTDLRRRAVRDQNVQETAVGDVRLIISRAANGKTVATLYRPKTAAPATSRAVFQSPTGREEYDEVVAWNDLPVWYAPDGGGYVIEAAVPWRRLGVEPRSGLALLGDVGVIFGNKGGTRNAVRFLWSDKGPEVSINNDVPSEVRTHPNQWGKLILK